MIKVILTTLFVTELCLGIIYAQGANLNKGYLMVKFLDSSEKKINDWYFLYTYAEHDAPPS